MRYLIGGTALCGLLTLAGTPSALAGAPAKKSPARRGAPTRRALPSIEKSLLGVRILQSYKAVMGLYGQPTRVYRIDEEMLTLDALDAKGVPTGGIRGIDDGAGGSQIGGAGRMAGGGMMGGPAGMMGAPGMMRGGGGGKMAAMGASGAPGMMGSSSGMMGGPPPGALQGMMAASMANRMGSSGAPGMMGSSSMGAMMGGGGRPIMGASGSGGGMGLPGAGGAGANGQGQTFADAGGSNWVYFYPNKELLYSFAMNKDNRVIGVLELGRKYGLPTSRGIRLGDPVSAVYNAYGWPDNLEQQKNGLSLNYTPKYHVQFYILNNKVAGIAIHLNEKATFRFGGGGGQSAAGPGQMAGMGGGRPIMGAGGGGRPTLGAGGGGALRKGAGGGED